MSRLVEKTVSYDSYLVKWQCTNVPHTAMDVIHQVAEWVEYDRELKSRNAKQSSYWTRQFLLKFYTPYSGPNISVIGGDWRWVQKGEYWPKAGKPVKCCGECCIY